MSYDTKLYINPNPIEPYHFVPDPSIQLSDSKRSNVNYNGSTQKEYQHYMKRKWDKEFPDCYKDGNRHRSILYRACSFCKAGVLIENALNHLVVTFGKHGIEEREIKAMVNYCYNTNSESFGKSRGRINDLRRQGRKNQIGSLRKG